ncbi:MAG: DUF3153 domain-containing protein [Cyanobacteria bacterium J06638_7]
MSSDPRAGDALATARRALDRGDYGQALGLLEPLVSATPAATPQAGRLQLLLATAWMGRGDTPAALACCRLAAGCSDPGLRQQARDLLEVLEAPALSRPRHWSLTLPALEAVEPLSGALRQRSRRSRSARPPEPPPPPVGPTRTPLALAVLAALLLVLTLLLGGCVQVRAELHFGAPGRLQLVQQLSSAEGRLPWPWQRQFADGLRELGLRPSSSPEGDRVLRLQGPMQPAAAALDTLAASVQEAGRLAGVPLPPPQLLWQERNWLVGVRQQLRLDIDLRTLAAVPGADVSLDLEPLRLGAVRRALPEPARPLPPGRRWRAAQLRWPLRLGERNQLELRCWRWNPLGLGALAIAAALALVLLLAGLRQRLGFGWPELPA